MKDVMQGLSQAVRCSQEIQECQQVLHELPIKVAGLLSEFQALVDQFELKKTEKAQLESQKSQLQMETQHDAQHVSDKETRLNSLKTQKEFQAVSKEISLAKQVSRERELKLEKIGSSLDHLESEMTPLQGRIDQLRPQAEEEQQAAEKTLSEVRSKLSELQSQLHEVLSNLPNEIREKYTRLVGVREPPAALVLQGTCQECFLNVPPQLFIEIQKLRAVHSCPNCHRLLYVE